MDAQVRPRYWKVRVRPLRSHESTMLAPVFTRWKKPEEDFGFREKKAKSENSDQYLSGREALQRQREWPRE